ncbi:MAG TPA: sigma-54 dependent transcriptional regulator [Verrucomicrobiae bacterium]|nr:sigma-54 dependent transcriptional regulator [Verrucomicrobiae bacterium]
MSAVTQPLWRELKGKVLVASPYAPLREQMLKKFAVPNASVSEARGGADALMKLEKSDFGTLLLDPRIEDLDVGELMATLQGRYPNLDVVLMESDADRDEEPDDAKPAQASATANLLSARSTAPATYPPPVYRPYPFEIATETFGSTEPRTHALPGMIGTSLGIQQIYRLARLVAPRDTAVLIVGETGTGKELVARGIHDLSRRSKGPFMVVNCAAIPESLLEAELFGFTRGAFTGAFQSRLGRIHAAHGGTLLLDEVGELPLGMQAKLLRFVQEGEVQRLGSADVFRVDARLIASTNANLLQRVREKQFREDLYYRLSVFPVDLPPLRERTGDTLPLAQHFLDGFCRSSGVTPKVFSPEAASLLQRYHWPGNVRELQHSVERAFVLAEDNPWIHVENLAMLTGAPDLTKF